ncbi:MULTISPECIES: formylglycine-generating enzyme family protein [unclassified Microcoleus]|uniref:formylglycine-generating enzyme family protein n=1 Tax=unclassified Microcoleus TaxID=2642155 RepID=UPI002FD65FDE
MESDYSQTAMREIIAKPGRTYGLVVGIEKYSNTSWNVGGPANDALKFADWLCKRDVPKENIRLCLSLLEENNHLLEQSDFTVEEATEQNLSNIIENNFSKQKGDLLYIFWAGHGLLSSERERRLLCADATSQNWRNLDLDSLLLLLKSNLFGIKNHICILDACANYLLESDGRPTNLKGKQFSSGQPMRDYKQFVLLATREGEKAIVNTKCQTGYFSQAVREALEQEPLETWPPNMKVISEKVQQQVTSLNNKQLPIFFDSCSWDGDRQSYRLNELNLPDKTPHLNDESGKNISAKPLTALIPDTTTFEFEVVTVDAQGRETKRCPKQAQYFLEILGNGVELEMVSIPGGKFTMGAPKEELESGEEERPQHLVTVKPFFMGKYPITQAQWRAIASLPKIKRDLDPDPSCFKGDNRPIERVSWYDAEEFCDRLSEKKRRLYRLPSEAEWEYACRARETTPFHFGATISTNLANYCGQNQKIKCRLYKGTYGNEPNGIYRQETSEVDIFSANAFGIHDMHGLVWEWCADYYHKNYQDAPSDGSIWLINGNEEGRILRGGSWTSPPNICRSASRFFGNPSSSNKNVGFRVVCSFV